MKYVPPYGSTDPSASYVNGDPSIARQGSIPPAACFEEPQREVVAAIQFNGFIPSDADLTQLLQGTRSQFSNYCQDTGSINTLSVALNPALAKYTLGLPLRVRVNQTNTSAATIDAGCGRVYVRRPDGSNVMPGDLPAGGIVELAFDGTGFQMVNYQGGASTGSITNNYNNIPYAVDTSTTANVIIAPFSPAITTVKAGDPLLVKVANTTTAATTLQVNAMPAVACKVTGSGTDLLQNDITAGDIKLFIFDGTYFQIAPNVMLTANITLNVPTTAYPTVQLTLTNLQRKRIHGNAMVTIQVASGNIAPFNIYHPDADRITIKGTMLGAHPGINDISRRGSDYNSQVADGWANHSMLLSRFGTVVQCANGQIGVTNSGPGNPTVQDILVTGPFNCASNPIGSAAAWDGSSAFWTEPSRSLTCNGVAAWGMGWACFEGRGKLTVNNSVALASINGESSRYGGGFIIDTNGCMVGNFFTGVNADEQSTWVGVNMYITNNMTGIQPYVMGYCHAANCYIAGNAVWDVQGIQMALSFINGGNIGSCTPPANGGMGNNGSWTILS
jgi:hypothetical protein